MAGLGLPALNNYLLPPLPDNLLLPLAPIEVLNYLLGQGQIIRAGLTGNG